MDQNVIKAFFCDHNNNRLLEINHNPKEGFNKNSNLLSLNPLRVVESAALEDCKKTQKDLFRFSCCEVGNSVELT